MKISAVKHSRNTRGVTLIEVLVVMTLVTLILGLAYSSWRRSSGFSSITRSKIDSRQMARTAVNFINSDIRKAAYIYPRQTISLAGHEYSTPDVEGSARDILMALPEAGTDPVTYTVIGYYLRKRTRIVEEVVNGKIVQREEPYDPANADSYQLVRFEAGGITPVTPSAPETIDFDGITNGNTRAVAENIDNDNFGFYLGQDGEFVNVTLPTKSRVYPSNRYEKATLYLTVKLRNKGY